MNHHIGQLQQQQRRRRVVIGGHDAAPDRFPYFVRLDYDGEFGCGGTVIHRDFVLTAAHCAYPADIDIIDAYIGAIDHSRDNNTNGTGVDGMLLPRRPIQRIFQHPAYNDYSLSNDMALLQIDPPLSDEEMKLIKGRVLPINTDRHFLTEGDSVTVIGLGLTETIENADGDDDDEAIADVLQEVELKVVDDESCDTNYVGDIHQKSMICATDPNQDSCSGDSGGPLLVLGDTPEDDILVGVVSFGEDCAHPEIPGVYADIAYSNRWVQSTICQNSIDPPENCDPNALLDSTAPMILGPDDHCRDFDGAFYASWWNQFQRCDWLQEGGRTSIYCNAGNEAWVRCPFSCHSCTYERDDDYFVDDDYTNYEQSSSPIAFIAVFVLSIILCCQFCCWAKRRVRGDATIKSAKTAETNNVEQI